MIQPLAVQTIPVNMCHYLHLVRVNGKNQGYHSMESALLHLGKLHKILRSEENENNIDQND